MQLFRRLGFLIALLLATTVTPIALAADDDWPRYGHDSALTGRSPLKGRIASPRVAWMQSIAGREVLLEVTPEAGEHLLRIPTKEKPDKTAAQQVPTPGPAMLDVDGTGTLRPAVETSHERWAKLLPDVRGLQRTAWSHTWTTEKVCRLQLFAYDQGFDKPRMVWQSDPPEDTIFNPLNVVYDIDGDGVQEVCVAAHYRVMIFEGTTGRKETELKYHSCRPYGWFGLADVDADGQMELVTIGDFQSHLDVLKYDPKRPEKERLSVLWRRDIETDITQRRKWPQVGPEPVVNVAGNARPEIVINLFNDTGDNEWHTAVLDATNGKSICDLPRRFYQGSVDVDHDGTRELFVTASDGLFVPTAGVVELVKIADGQPNVIWTRENSRWVVANLPRMASTWSSTGSGGMRQVLAAQGSEKERPVFAVWTRNADAASQPSTPRWTTTLTTMSVGSGPKPDVVWQVNGLPGEVEPVSLARVQGAEQASALVRVRLATGLQAELIGKSAAVRVVHDEPLTMQVSPPIAARIKPDSPLTVVAEAPGGVILAIDAPRDGLPPRAMPLAAGRGMADGSRFGGVLAVDLDNDGFSEVVAADQAFNGEAVLVAHSHNGTLWEKRFERVPASAPVWNEGALTFWWPGHFRGREKTDLFVNTRRGPMHSDIGHLLDGTTGQTLWSQEKAIAPDQFQWGYAGIPLAVADTDGNGSDELVNLYPVDFWIAEGATGLIKAAKDLSSQKELPAWAAYGEPMVRDFNGDGRPEVLLDSVYILALLDTIGKPIWHGLGRADYPTTSDSGNVGETTSVKHALVDFDGDGTFEIASGGYKDGVRAIDPRDGKILWSLTAPEPTCQRVAAADIDGRRGDELLYAAGDTLVVVTGDRKGGRILWTWKGPAALSMPAIADVDADGQAEIVLQTAHASVVCLDSDPTR